MSDFKNLANNDHVEEHDVEVNRNTNYQVTES